MHRIIGVIVYAGDRTEAIGSAESTLGELCNSGPYDYFEIMDVVRANTQKGEALVADLWKATKEDFVENITVLREALSKLNDEQAFGKMGDMDVRWRAYQIGAYVGGVNFLYNHRGAAIRNDEDLQETLTKTYDSKAGEVLSWMPETPKIPNDVWIVKADVHS